MHSILLIVKKPDMATPNATQIWQMFSDNATKITKPNTDILLLTEGVWLIPWKGGLPFVSALVQAAKVLANSPVSYDKESFQLSYKALILDDGAEWSE